MNSENSTTSFVLGTSEKPEPIAGFPDFGHISLKGLANIRDLGGMPAANGRSIKRGRLIRSNALHHATASDIEQLVNHYQVKRVFDFRSEGETKRHPDPVKKMEGVEFFHTPVFNVASVAEPSTSIAHNKELISHLNGNMHNAIRAVYPRCLLQSEGIAAYRAFFKALLKAEDGATLWHCTEGKDRTGLAAVLVEHALGVSDENIRKDYLATNLFAQTATERMMDMLGRHHLLTWADSDIDSVFYAYEDYLDSALDAVNQAWGSLDTYLEQQLGVNSYDRQQLQAMYLE